MGGLWSPDTDVAGTVRLVGVPGVLGEPRGPRVQVSLPVSSLLEGEQFRTKDREHHLGNPILGGIEVFGCCNNSFLPR